MSLRTFCTLSLAFVLAQASPAAARIKLATLPVRERVELQLDNGSYTLVEEERIVPLLQSSAKTGNNAIDFSWSNAAIDKDSIQFRPLAVREGNEFRALKKVEGKDEIAVINVAYPPNENALVWEVYSANAVAAKVRVSYLISNLGRSFNYRASANKDETELSLRAFIKLRNYSGEEFGDSGVWAGFGPRYVKPVGNQEEWQMLLAKYDNVPIKKTFTFDWYQNGQLNAEKPLASPIHTHYELVNDGAHKLGEFPLQPGKVRMFIDDGRKGEAFLGEDIALLTPLDGKLRLFLGQSQDIVCTRMIARNERHVVRGNLFDQEIIVKYEIENYREKACTVDIVEQLNRLAQQYAAQPRGDVEWELGDRTARTLKITREDGGAVPKLHIDLPARPKPAANAAPGETPKVSPVVVEFHVILKNLW
jgi:hypothetical protein